jgi:hypothetical protein
MAPNLAIGGRSGYISNQDGGLMGPYQSMAVYQKGDERFICDGRGFWMGTDRSVLPLFGPFDSYHEAAQFWQENDIYKAFKMVRSATRRLNGHAR